MLKRYQGRYVNKPESDEVFKSYLEGRLKTIKQELNFYAGRYNKRKGECFELVSKSSLYDKMFKQLNTEEWTDYFVNHNYETRKVVDSICNYMLELEEIFKNTEIFDVEYKEKYYKGIHHKDKIDEYTLCRKKFIDRSKETN